MKISNDFAQMKDLTSHLIWTAAFGKALIKKGILTKQEVEDELLKYKGKSDELDNDITNMIDNLKTWP